MGSSTVVFSKSWALSTRGEPAQELQRTALTLCHRSAVPCAAIPSLCVRKPSQSLLRVAKALFWLLPPAHFAALFTKWSFTGDAAEELTFRHLQVRPLKHREESGLTRGHLASWWESRGYGWKPQSRVALLSDKEHSTQFYTRPCQKMPLSAFAFFGNWREETGKISFSFHLFNICSAVLSPVYNFLSDAAFGIQQLSLLSVFKIKLPLGVTLLLFVPLQITDELFNICQASLFISLTIETYNIYQCPGDVSGS